MPPHQNSNDTRLSYMNAIVLIVAVISILAAAEIANGARLHQLNFLQTQDRHLFMEVIAGADHTKPKDSTAIHAILQRLRIQSAQCARQVNFLENAATYAISKISVRNICRRNMAIVNSAVASFEKYSSNQISFDSFVAEIGEANALFTQNAALLERAVADSIVVILLIAATLVTSIAFATIAIGWRISDVISLRYKRATDAGLELSQRNEVLEHMSHLKSEFLANMSHEIRTPLNGMLGVAQIMRQEETDPARIKNIEIMLSSGHSLLDIVDDVLDIAKIEAGRMELDLQAFSLEALINQVRNTFQAAADQKSLTLDFDIHRSARGLFEGDPVRLRQVLTNLVGNAVKFTDRGRVRMRVRRRRDGMLRFSVLDTGPGIPLEKLPLVFSRFQQADTSSTRTHGGTGLGLSISTEFVKLMNGVFGARSKVGVGSLFWFAVPLKPIAERVNSDFPSTRESVGLPVENNTPVRVLICEDNPVNRMITELAIRTAGFQPTLSENGAEAIERLDCGDFDIVLMDIHMPVMAGDVAIREIRKSGKPYANIPIIVLTANVMKGAEEYYKQIGADEFVSKPIKFEVLTAKVKQLTRRRSAERAGTAAHLSVIRKTA